MKLRVPALGQAQDLAQVKMIPITKAQMEVARRMHQGRDLAMAWSH